LILETLMRMSKTKKEAERWHELLKAIGPLNPKRTIATAKTLLNLKQPEKARKLIMRLLQAQPEAENAEINKQLANTWIPFDNVKARALLLRALREEPSSDTYMILAGLQRKLKKNESAIAAYREALILNPGLTEARFALAELLITEGELKTAIKELNIIVKNDPTNLKALEILGDNYRELGQIRKAAVQYQAGLKASPDSVPLLLKTARLQLYQLNEIKLAVKTLQKSIQLEPYNAEAHYMLGFAHKDLDDLDLAKAEFETYLKLAPDGEFSEEVTEELSKLGGSP